MSRSAGTLITTNNATYYNPRFMPGYRGHCPTVQFDFGETYGNATHKYFRDYRSTVLNSSADPYCRGGNFPTYYTHDPTLVISNRTRTRDRWLHTPKYQLSNRDHDRKVELNLFDDLSQKHREFYTDKTGTRKKVAYFDLPVSAEEQFKKNKPFYNKPAFYMVTLNDPMDVYNPHDPMDPYMNNCPHDPSWRPNPETPGHPECRIRTPYCIYYPKYLTYGMPGMPEVNC